MPSTPGDPTAEAQYQAFVGLMRSSLVRLRTARRRGT
jgi:hypothetical protein